MESELLTKREAARYLRMSERTLHRLKMKGEIPFVPQGERWVRFLRSDLDAWIEKQRIDMRRGR